MFRALSLEKRFIYGAGFGIFAVVGGLYGFLAGAVAFGAAVIAYHGFRLVRYGSTRSTWRDAARELESIYDTEDPDAPTDLDFSDPNDGTFPSRRPSESELELSGTLEGRPVRIRATGDNDLQRTVWEIDCTEFLPDWLNLRPAGVRARADWWVETGDVKIGHEELDQRFLVGGAEADRVRAFFWDHELGDDVTELFDEVGSFEVADGVLRNSHKGMVRDGHTLERETARLITIAAHLEQVVTAAYPETELPDDPVDEEWDESLREEREEEAAHVYD